MGRATVTKLIPDLQSPSATTPVLVLVVDDEESVRTYVTRVLQKAGYRTVVALDGPNALRVGTKLEGLDLLVTDMMMAGMNGDELAQHLRAVHPHLKVLYLTGFSDHLFKYRPGLWENERLLDKPFNPTDLLTTVSSLVSPPGVTPQ